MDLQEKRTAFPMTFGNLTDSGAKAPCARSMPGSGLVRRVPLPPQGFGMSKGL